MGRCRYCETAERGQDGYHCDPCGAMLREWYEARKKKFGWTSEAQPAYFAMDKRKSDASKRGAEKRRLTDPNWGRPVTAEVYWQRKAHRMVASAIKRGVLPKLDGAIACADCGQPARIYEHRDYGRPLDVVPACTTCNLKRGTATWPDASRFQFKRIEHK